MNFVPKPGREGSELKHTQAHIRGSGIHDSRQSTSIPWA